MPSYPTEGSCVTFERWCHVNDPQPLVVLFAKWCIISIQIQNAFCKEDPTQHTGKHTIMLTPHNKESEKTSKSVFPKLWGWNCHWSVDQGEAGRPRWAIRCCAQMPIRLHGNYPEHVRKGNIYVYITFSLVCLYICSVAVKLKILVHCRSPKGGVQIIKMEI